MSYIYRTSSVSKTQNEPTLHDYINNFMNENSKTGAVVFEVHNDNPVRGRIPVPNAKVTLSTLLGGDYYLSNIAATNANGETDPILLPTVSRDLSLRPGENRVFSSYRASVEAPGYQRQDIYDIQVFDGITTIQHINLLPVPGAQPGQTAPARPTTPPGPTAPTAPARPTGLAASTYEMGY
jgi:hypothetical protein